MGNELLRPAIYVNHCQTHGWGRYLYPTSVSRRPFSLKDRGLKAWLLATITFRGVTSKQAMNHLLQFPGRTTTPIGPTLPHAECEKWFTRTSTQKSEGSFFLLLHNALSNTDRAPGSQETMIRALWPLSSLSTSLASTPSHQAPNCSSVHPSFLPIPLRHPSHQSKHSLPPFA